MALLRLLWFPSTTLSNDQHGRKSLILQKPSQIKFSLSSLVCSTSPISHVSDIRPSRTRRTNLLFFNFSSATQHHCTSSSSSITIESPGLESESESSRTRLIAQNIPWTCTPEDIRTLFEKYGTVSDVELSMHNKIKNRGLAFIDMGSEEEALSALTNLESYELEGRAIKVNYAKTLKKRPSARPEPVTKHNVFVGNLSWRARSKDLREFFSSGSGKVRSAEVIFQSNPRRSTGYGFVSFSSKEDADAAVSAFNGKKFMGRPIRLGLSKKSVGGESEESTQSEETSNEVNGDGGLPDKVDEI
ncbi:hypothetical protein HHK36_003958 [Tetracentron sinense]|uniref:RRM domain-containing protein n=1 Tax=Tetracentron sinense TaxID=13715 RepID=A0A835DSN7_TETSI|nr:hypothetical protein HHK36_003958 [Tetracentron sinense]